MVETFADFFDENRRAAASSYVIGDASLVEALSTTAGQATFFAPPGTVVQGAKAVNSANREGAVHFGPGGTTRLDVLDMGESGDLAFWCGLQHATIDVDGKRQALTLRVTEAFRRTDDGWKMVHRHASPLNEDTQR